MGKKISIGEWISVRYSYIIYSSKISIFIKKKIKNKLKYVSRNEVRALLCYSIAKERGGGLKVKNQRWRDEGALAINHSIFAKFKRPILVVFTNLYE